MSLFTRFESGSGYWTCLDVVAVHFQRLRRSSKAGIIPCRESGSGAPNADRGFTRLRKYLMVAS